MAAQKAFIVTRVGDTALAIGLFMLFEAFGTLQLQEILAGAEGSLPAAANTTVIALLLLGGAIGKSAQRSEEHTSELQSLMRTSYAVFCLKKKITQTTETDTYHTSAT